MTHSCTYSENGDIYTLTRHDGELVARLDAQNALWGMVEETEPIDFEELAWHPEDYIVTTLSPGRCTITKRKSFDTLATTEETHAG